MWWTVTYNQMKSRCRMEITYFPFDTQNCIVNFGSTRLPARDIYYRLYSSDNVIYNYTENKLWELLKFTKSELDVFKAGEFYRELRFKLTIKRKPVYIIANIVVPALILSCITIITFFIPFPQAIAISISAILSYSVLSIR